MSIARSGHARCPLWPTALSGVSAENACIIPQKRRKLTSDDSVAALRSRYPFVVEEE